VTWRTQRRHAVSGAGVDYSTLIARRKAVVALVKAGVGAALPAAAAAPSLDTAPAPGKERAWFDALKAEASAQLDTIAGWIKTGTAAAKAKAKAALEAMRPTLEELDKVAKLALLANPMTMPGYVTADLTTRTADMVDELGGVKTVGNIALILAALWAWHKWG
jgi:hypothetical protein